MILAYKKLTKIVKKYCLILIDEDLLTIKNELKEVAKAQKITIQIDQDNNESQTIEQKPYNKTNNFHNINYDDMINILVKKAQGKTNKEIADAICVNEKTIRNNLKKALEKTSKKERVLIDGKVIKVRVYCYQPYPFSDKAQIENCRHLIWYLIKKGSSINHLFKKAVF